MPEQFGMFQSDTMSGIGGLAFSTRSQAKFAVGGICTSVKPRSFRHLITIFPHSHHIVGNHNSSFWVEHLAFFLRVGGQSIIKALSWREPARGRHSCIKARRFEASSQADLWLQAYERLAACQRPRSLLRLAL